MAVLLLLVLLMLLSGWYVEYGVFVIARALLLLVTWLGLAAEYGCCWLLVELVLVEVEEEVQEEASCAPQLSLALTLVALVVVVVAEALMLLLLLLGVAVTAGDLLLVDEFGDCNV